MWLKDPAFQMDRQLSKHFLLNNPLFSLSFWKTACNIYQIATVHIYHLSLNFLFHPTNWKNQMLSDWFKVYSSIQRMDCQWQILPSPFNSCYYFCPFLFIFIEVLLMYNIICFGYIALDQIRSDQSLSRVRLFATPWIAARQASLSITNSQSSLRLTSIESVMPSSHLILCHPLLLLPPIPPGIRVFSNESTLRMRRPKYCCFSFSIIPSKEIPGLISFRMDWLDLLAVQGS